MWRSFRVGLHPRYVLTVLIVAGTLALAAQRQPDVLEGDWAGWLYLTAGGDAPFRLHVTTGAGGYLGTLDLPANQLYEDTLERFERGADSVRFSRTSSRGTQQLWEGELREGTISGQLAFDGETVGTFELHRSAVPLPGVLPERYADCAGVYRFDSPARAIIVSPRFWGELLYLDTQSGRFATLFPTSDSTFFAGSAMYVPDTVLARATCRRDAGRVTGLVWQEGESGEVGQRIDLTEEEVEFTNGEVTLRGTLIEPAGFGALPGIVVLGGSNWEQRGSIRSDADILASTGMAVLIYDKRGFGESTGEAIVSFQETASDARAAVRFLAERPEIMADEIGVMGRSRGGWFAPLAAAGSDDIAFVLLFVAPAVSPAAQETTRRLNALRARGYDEDELAIGAAYLDLQWRYARTGRGWEEYAAARSEMEERGWLDELWGPGEPEHEDWEWSRLNAFYDPVPTLERLMVPTLAIYGERDDNVVPEVNVPILEATLRRAGNRDYRIVVVPGADHSLRLVEERGEPLHRRRGYAPAVWQTVFAWLERRLDPSR